MSNEGLVANRAALSTARRIARSNLLRSALAALALCTVLRLFVVQVYGIRSGSMRRTLMVGDWVVANNTVFGAAIPFTSRRVPALREPAHGEVVVYRPAGYSPVQDHIKRIIGVPGDTVQMVRGVLYRNATAISEPYVQRATDADVPLPVDGPYNFQWQLNALARDVDRRSYAPTRDTWGPLIVPAGHYLMLGDDRGHSVDTRYTGFVPRDEIRAKVLAIHWSFAAEGLRWNRIGRRP